MERIVKEIWKKRKISTMVLAVVFMMLAQSAVVKAEETAEVTVDGILYELGKETKTATVKEYKNNGSSAYTEIVIPANVSYGGDEYAVTLIASYAFWSSSYVEKIEIPTTVTEIGSLAFARCVALKEINLPSGLKKISEAVFYDCTSLEEIEIPTSVEIIDDQAFLNCKKIKRIVIPNGVTELGVCCFSACDSLEEIVIPNSVKIIEDAVFWGCGALVQVVIPENVESISVSTFDVCDNLESIFYPNHLREVLGYGRYDYVAQASYVINADGTVSLTVENLPDGVTGINLPSDIGGRRITSITGPEGVEISVSCTKHYTKTYTKSADAHQYTCVLCKKDVKEAHSHTNGSQPCECGYVPFVIAVQPASQQLACGYKTGSLAVTVKKTFGKEAVSYQWSEDGKAIAGATAESYTIPKGKKVGTYTYTCKMTSGGYSAVTPAAAVTVKAPVKGKKYKDDNNMATYKVTKARMDGKGTAEYVKPVNKKKSTVIIPATVKIGGVTYKVTSIAKNAFKGNKKIKRLTIEENVEKIGARAFCNCKKLKNITIKTKKLKAKKIGADAFTNIKSNAAVKVPKKKFKAYKTMLMKKGMGSKVKFRKI